MVNQTYPRPALIVLDSWAGLFEQRVRVIGETARRYRIEADEDVRLAGRNRHLAPGKTALVPKHAVVML